MLASLHLFSKPHEVKEYIVPDCSRVNNSFWVSAIRESVAVVRKMEQPEWPAWVLLLPLYGAVGELCPKHTDRGQGKLLKEKEGIFDQRGDNGRWGNPK